jgi:NAD(P)-dependent dehydrogenase (short-subunit alcohol dehydrogenase family)
MTKKKVVFITGTSRGLGLALKERLSSAGHVVVGSSRTPEASSLDLALDITDEVACQKAIDEVVQKHGRLDVVINNAGMHLYGAALETSPVELRAQMELNFYGAVNVLQAAVPQMLDQGSGRIINVSSIGGRLATPFASAYNASKFALEGYTEALRAELAPFNVWVTNLEPGFINTGTTAQSIVSVAGSHPTFTEHRLRARAHMEEGSAKGVDLKTVAAKVERLLGSRRPPFRVSVDGMVTRLETLRFLLPSSVFARLLVANTAPGFPSGA